MTPRDMIDKLIIDDLIESMSDYHPQDTVEALVEKNTPIGTKLKNWDVEDDGTINMTVMVPQAISVIDVDLNFGDMA